MVAEGEGCRSPQYGGRYSALLLQIKDNRPWNEEVDTSLVKNLGEAALVKLIPYGSRN
jgi:hypothetical protein